MHSVSAAAELLVTDAQLCLTVICSFSHCCYACVTVCVCVYLWLVECAAVWSLCVVTVCVGVFVASGVCCSVVTVCGYCVCGCICG